VILNKDNFMKENYMVKALLLLLMEMYKRDTGEWDI